MSEPTESHIVELYDDYHTARRNETAPGPWLDEKDIMLWVDPQSGLPCIARRNPQFAWAGYVGVPDGTDIDYDEMEVHGKVNIAHVWNYCIPLAWAAALPLVDWAKTRWPGFDCAHLGDLIPPRVGERESRASRLVPEIYRDRAYIIGQVTSLARQIATAMDLARSAIVAATIMRLTSERDRCLQIATEMRESLYEEFKTTSPDGVSRCGLCGNTGMLDTRTTAKTHGSGLPCGVLQPCICPNGRVYAGKRELQDCRCHEYEAPRVISDEAIRD